MRNIFRIAIAALVVFNLYGCEKCYQCHNYCKVCREVHQDTTLTIIVKSDVFTEQYFVEYLDSLNSLGWTCNDTSSTKQETFCGTNSQNNGELLTRKENGWICAPSE